MASAEVRIARDSEGKLVTMQCRLKKRPLRGKRVPFTAAEQDGVACGSPTRVKCGGGYRIVMKKLSSGNY